MYRVQLALTAARPLNGFTLSDPLPVGATLLDGSNTLALGTLPAGDLALSSRSRFTGAPAAAVTDPLAGWKN